MINNNQVLTMPFSFHVAYMSNNKKHYYYTPKNFILSTEYKDFFTEKSIKTIKLLNSIVLKKSENMLSGQNITKCNIPNNIYHLAFNTPTGAVLHDFIVNINNNIKITFKMRCRNKIIMIKRDAIIFCSNLNFSYHIVNNVFHTFMKNYIIENILKNKYNLNKIFQSKIKAIIEHII